MAGYSASFWTPDDLPSLYRLVKIHDQIERAEVAGSPPPYGEYRQMIDRFGLSPSGRQRLRWLPPVDEPQPLTATKASTAYGHLQAI
jgi:hypothetical protein